MTRLNLLPATALLGLLAAPLAAEPPSPPPPPPVTAPPAMLTAAPTRAHYALYDAIFSGMDMKTLAHNNALAIAQQIVARDPSLVRLQARRPQLTEHLGAAIEPYLALWMDRLKDQRRSTGATIMAHHFTAAEAQRVATFYASPLGKRMMAAISGNLIMDETIAAVGDPEQASHTAAEQRDIKNALGKTVPAFVASMTPSDRQQVLKMMADPAFAKLKAASAELGQLPEPEFSTFATPEELKQAKAAIDKVITEELAAS